MLNEKAREEFEWLKEEMASERVVLQHPDWNAPFYVQTDACADGLGAVLAQRVKHPVTILGQSGRFVTLPVPYRLPKVSGLLGSRNSWESSGLVKSGATTFGVGLSRCRLIMPT